MKIFSKLVIATVIALIYSCAGNQKSRPHIVFVIGDEEYRSEESMPMLAQIAKRELNAKVTLCYSVDSLGYIDPNRTDHIEGLKALETADLMVMYTRFRNLPEDELKYILDYAESGKPMIGFRTSTHAFRYPDDPSMKHMNNEWPANVFGQQWITHHGHFDDGANPLTHVELTEPDHPILKNVQPFEAYSWLYHVDGGKWNLQGDSEVLLEGTALQSFHKNKNRLDQYPLTNPVAWTKTYAGKNGTSKVFFTTLGHPYDWKNENMRRLAMNGIYWALDLKIPKKMNLDFVSPYEPNNSGFGDKYKKGLKPLKLEE